VGIRRFVVGLSIATAAAHAAAQGNYPEQPVRILVGGQVADVPMMLIAKKATPAANFADFLAYAKANKDKVTYANAGVGSASYLCGLLFMSAVQADFTMVPYKGTGPAMNDLVGGQVDFMCDQTTNTVPQIKSGNVKAYGVTTASRIASFPNLPTLDEQGLKGFDLGAEPVPPSKATPAALGMLLKAEVEKWAPIIKKSGVYAD